MIWEVAHLLDRPRFSEEPLVAPFAVTGGVLAFFGALLLCFSVEVCVRLRKNAKRVKDPEIDKLKNLHHIKHWMPPGEGGMVEECVQVQGDSGGCECTQSCLFCRICPSRTKNTDE